LTHNPTLIYVQKAIDYIDDNIANPLDARSIADHIAISVSYLKKIFKSVTDLSLIDYARARKLNHCLDLLNRTKKTISDIALSNGYDYEQSFSRAFKQRFGISPKHYRDNTTEIELIPKLDLSFIIELKDAMIVQPVFRRLPAFQLGGLLHRVSIEDKYQYKPSILGKDFYYNHKDDITSPVRNDDYYGYTLPDDAYESSTRYLTGLKVDANSKLPEGYHGYTLPDDAYESSTRYLTGLKVDANSKLPEGYHIENVPEQTYIVFKFIGNFDASKITWEHLKSIWEFRDKYLKKAHNIHERIYGYFEYIDTRISSDDYCELELYVPIKD